MQRRDGNGITFDCTLPCGLRRFCRMEKSPINSPQEGQICWHCGTLPASARRLDEAIHSGSSQSLQVCEQYPQAVLQRYLFCSKDQALASLQANVTSMLIPFSTRIAQFHADQAGEYTGKVFQTFIGGRAFVHIKDPTEREHTSWELPSTEAYNIAHQMDYRGTFSAEYTDATTNLRERCLRGGEK